MDMPVTERHLRIIRFSTKNQNVRQCLESSGMQVLFVGPLCGYRGLAVVEISVQKLPQATYGIAIDVTDPTTPTEDQIKLYGDTEAHKEAKFVFLENALHAAFEAKDSGAELLYRATARDNGLLADLDSLIFRVHFQVASFRVSTFTVYLADCPSALLLRSKKPVRSTPLSCL